MTTQLKNGQSVSIGTSPVSVFTVPGASTALLHNLTIANKLAAAAISSITRSGTTATVTTSTNHGLATNNLVSIQNAYPAVYSCSEKVITVLSATTFTYQIDFDPGTNATSVGQLIPIAQVTVTWTDSSAATTASIVTKAPVPFGGTIVPIGDNNKQVLETADILIIVSDIAASVDASWAYILES